MKKKIKIEGAKQHNLKNVNLEIPRNKMTVFTGVSGSGKTSLAFDTIFAEGQRRYVESLSAYARQFLNRMNKPEVDEITGLSPAISIDQKAHSKNPRSTVATITEVYDFMRVLFARLGTPHCPECGRKIQTMGVTEMVDSIIKIAEEGNEIVVMAEVVRGRKGEYYQLLYDYLNQGFAEARIDGDFKSLRERIELEKNKKHEISIVIDRIPAEFDFTKKENRRRLVEAVETSLKKGGGSLQVYIEPTKSEYIFSEDLSCPVCNFAYPTIEPRMFSFNSPYGACEECKGIGKKHKKSDKLCPECKGRRLRPEALSILLADKNIVEVTDMKIDEAALYFSELDEYLSEDQMKIAKAPLREINQRLGFLLDIGLDYLTLDREAGTLSGGESQRIRLASQVGSGLVGTLYILDEPTIGLHQYDNARLIKTLKELKEKGNTIVVVEHDEETIMASDHLVDFGPGAGVHGGEIVAQGDMPDILEDENQDSLTLKYLRRKKKIPVPPQRRKVKAGTPKLKIKGASKNNLKNMNVDIPLRRFVTVTGVSGSGKSTLIYETLYKHLTNELHHADKKPGKFDDIKGLEYIDKVINIDQSPIGRTPRSTPGTYVSAWTDIRELFATTDEAKMRGWDKGRFSFNTKGGRCENCNGYGHISVEMHFLPTVQVTCDECKGKRFNNETLEVEYRGKNIYEVLNMTIEEAMSFFKDTPWIHRKLETLFDVGLGYLKLGQPSPTLSGGEAQRVKLASELSRKDTRSTLYLLDEPTVGLHYEDVRKLINVLQDLVSRGNSVVIIEHNLEIIKSSDYIIDLGPGCGENGGEIVVTGPPEIIKSKKKSKTAKFLRKIL